MCNRSISSEDFKGHSVVIVPVEKRPIKQWDIRWIEYSEEFGGRHPGIVITNTDLGLRDITTYMITSKAIPDGIVGTPLANMSVYIKLPSDVTMSRIKLDKSYTVDSTRIGDYIGNVSDNKKLRDFIMACSMATITGIIPVSFDDYQTDNHSMIATSNISVTKQTEHNLPVVTPQSDPEPKTSNDTTVVSMLNTTRKISRNSDPVELRLAIICNRWFDGDIKFMRTAVWMMNNDRKVLDKFIKFVGSTSSYMERFLTDFKVASSSLNKIQVAANCGSEYVEKMNNLIKYTPITTKSSVKLQTQVKPEIDKKNELIDRHVTIFISSLDLFKANQFVKNTTTGQFVNFTKLKGYRPFNKGNAESTCFDEKELLQLVKKYDFTLNDLWKLFNNGIMRFMVDPANKLYVFKQDMIKMGKSGAYTNGKPIDIK